MARVKQQTNNTATASTRQTGGQSEAGALPALLDGDPADVLARVVAILRFVQTGVLGDPDNGDAEAVQGACWVLEDVIEALEWLKSRCGGGSNPPSPLDSIPFSCARHAGPHVGAGFSSSSIQTRRSRIKVLDFDHLV